MAASIEADTGITPELVAGGRGEFTVWVDGARVAAKTADGFPLDEEVVSAVRQAMS